MKNATHPSIALVYDRVNTPYGGAENVLVSLHEMFPDAPLYTAVYDKEQAKWASVFSSIKSSFLQKIPGAKHFHRPFVGAMPLAFESFELEQFDIIISVTSAEAKGVLTKPHQLHVCYLLTPTRYLWSHAEEYESDPLTGWVRKIIFRYLRWWDIAAALRPDVYIPISRLVAERCQQFYHRSTEAVIYPPVELSLPASFNERPVAADYYLIVARLVPYKRIDLAIEACQELDRHLVIIGEGPDESRLRDLAASAPKPELIHLRKSVQLTQIGAYYSNCLGFLAPGEEDFGITVLEAQAAGKPVIVFHRSGAAEVVQDQHTGIHLQTQSVAELMQAMQQLETTHWSSTTIREQVQKYQKKHFQTLFREKIDHLWQSHIKHRGG